MLLLTTSLKLVVEIALMALLGQWLLGLIAGRKRDGNFFYQLLGVLTKPFTGLTRLISPRVVLDRHIPLATGLLLISLWIVVTLVRINICLKVGVQQCQA